MTKIPEHTNSKSTVGKTLQKARASQNLTLSQASASTRIRVEVLQALEEGDYSQFASEVYAKGFLKNYSKYLGLDGEKVMALYRRETVQGPKPKKQESDTEQQDKPKRRIQEYLYSRKGLTILAIIFVAILVGFYAINQLSALLYPPKLAITIPVNLEADYTGEIFVSGNSFQLEGITSPRTLVRLNSELLPIEADNTFSTSEIPLRESQFIVVISATNQFGRTSTINLTVKKGNPGIAEVDKMSVLILIEDEVTPLLVRADGKIQFDDRAFPGDVITFEANTRLQVETSSPLNVKLKINGEDFVVEGINTTWELIDGNVIKK